MPAVAQLDTLSLDQEVRRAKHAWAVLAFASGARPTAGAGSAHPHTAASLLAHAWAPAPTLSARTRRRAETLRATGRVRKNITTGITAMVAEAAVPRW